MKDYASSDLKNYTTTYKKLFVKESDEDVNGNLFYITVLDEDLDPIYPNTNCYGGKWKLINTCSNQEYIFWTWKFKPNKSNKEDDCW